MEVDEEEYNDNQSCLDSENYFMNQKFLGSSSAEMEVNKVNFSFAAREADDRIYQYHIGFDLNLCPLTNISRHKKAYHVLK